MKSPKSQVRAVYDDDLMVLLDRLGIMGDFKGGRLKCFACGDVLTSENFHAVFPDSGQVKGTCSKSNCVVALIERTTRR